MQSHEGTTMQIQVGKAKPMPAEELRETGKPLSHTKKDCGNPESTTVDEKPNSSQEENLRAKMARLWGEFSSLKKGVIIGGIVVLIILIIFITLLIISLSSKPKITLVYNNSVPLPNNDKINYYNVSATKPSLLTPNKKSDFSLTTITPSSSRLLQEGSDINVAVISLSHPESGVDILMTGQDDITLRVDYDQLLTYYSELNQGNRRLLFEMEMRSALRKLQQTEVDNAFAFDDPINLRSDAQASALKAYSEATGKDINDLEIRYIETVDVVYENGAAKEVSQTSSRLLRALSEVRRLEGGWIGVFDEVNTVTKAKLEEANDVLKNYIPKTEEEFEKAENSEFVNVLKKSNFNPAIEVVVEEEVEVAAAARLLQGSIEPSTSNPTTPSTDAPTTSDPSAPTTPTTPSTPSTPSTSPSPKPKPAKPERKSYYRPICRRNRASSPKSKKVINKGTEMSMKCTGRGKYRRCEKNATTDKDSAFKIEEQPTDTPRENRRASYEVRPKDKNDNKQKNNQKKGNLNKENDKKKPEGKPIPNQTSKPSNRPQPIPTGTPKTNLKPNPTTPTSVPTTPTNTQQPTSTTTSGSAQSAPATATPTPTTIPAAAPSSPVATPGSDVPQPSLASNTQSALSSATPSTP